MYDSELWLSEVQTIITAILSSPIFLISIINEKKNTILEIWVLWCYDRMGMENVMPEDGIMKDIDFQTIWADTIGWSKVYFDIPVKLTRKKNVCNQLTKLQPKHSSLS